MNIAQLLHAGMNQQTKEVTGETLMMDTGAAENQATCAAGDDTDGGGNSSGDEETPPDNTRLLERGVALHALSADEGEEDGTDEEMDARDLTPEEAAAAVLDAPDDDQEGLALTGGNWFNTIKQAAK
jgi:hypothetical protein